MINIDVERRVVMDGMCKITLISYVQYALTVNS